MNDGPSLDWLIFINSESRKNTAINVLVIGMDIKELLMNMKILK